ncbi:phosphatase PAP2 family protein [Acidilutibacter cellobiosedens]|uniref:Phosphatase PAP2 family protein n=1 Tax=Acidilutibacter cellobiosedens TaxID=2507161 RepID=A0A410QGW5_9FIRM|nr:phosphatase PAP2 family protein [Acidilutibacter cellobiosedens]QAT63186.1 phosphatase PAP2 family protein [Acidilutibacter cellobiosedens]
MNRRKIWFVIVPIILFVMLAICLKAEIVTRFEGWAYEEASENMSSALTLVMKGITHLGDPAVIIIFCLTLFIRSKTRKNIALPVSIAVMSSAVLNITLKHIFARSRPNILQLISETGYSFPSGHAMNNASLYVMLILLIWKYDESTSLKIIFSSICIILTVLIGWSRIYLGVHYASDILGGWLFGFALSTFVYFLWNNKLSR